MKFWKKFAMFSLAVIMLFSGSIMFVGCGTKDYNKIELNEVTHSIFYAPLYVAINEGFFKEETCRRDVFDMFALQELRKHGQRIVFGFLMLFLLDENLEMQQVYGAGQVGVQVALQVRVVLENFQPLECLVVVFFLVAESHNPENV